MSTTSPTKDKQTVAADGQPVMRLIDGVIINSAVTHIDDRGSLCEIHTPYAAPLEKPLVYVYQFTIRPGKIKGWHVHHLHDDRIFLSHGHVKVVLYDSRTDSPTFGMINEIYRSDLNRDLMVIPAFVYHAHQNIGTTDALFISMPTRAYQHDDPDVYRFPIDSGDIPYKFDTRPGW
jgi:dTDP-4-dehydrorhamnose 3,5-epimerase